jgi:hypothetical protein
MDQTAREHRERFLIFYLALLRVTVRDQKHQRVILAEETSVNTEYFDIDKGDEYSYEMRESIIQDNVRTLNLLAWYVAATTLAPTRRRDGTGGLDIRRRAADFSFPEIYGLGRLKGEKNKLWFPPFDQHRQKRTHAHAHTQTHTHTQTPVGLKKYPPPQKLFPQTGVSSAIFWSNLV